MATQLRGWLAVFWWGAGWVAIWSGLEGGEKEKKDVQLQLSSTTLDELQQATTRN
jgi:hypothetical protein